ncbi:MAG TPA: M23 family metallopeptidase, partial [Ilumatobacteraceae bacterium]
MSAHLRTLGTIVGLAGSSFLVIAGTAHAAPPPVTVTMAEPFQGGAIVVERTAGETTGQLDRWRMNQDIWLQNTGPDTLVLDSVTITYTGGSDPADITVPAASFDAIGDDPMNLNQIPAGATSRLKVPEERVHAFPIADSVSVSIRFVGFDPIVVTRDLDEYIGDGPLGSLAFPSAAKDLAPGEYWAHGTGHQLRDHHRNQFWERFAEDWGVWRWDGAAWTDKTADPALLGNSDWNDDYLIWGKGLYVAVPGEIVACANGHADDSFPSEDVAGVGDYGNFVQVDTGTARILYAHMQAGTVPASICPVDPTQEVQFPNPPIPVHAGQFVGRVGNSGNTSNAHLHIDIQRNSDGQGLPLRYHNTQAASSLAFDPNSQPPP